jgi:DNA-binding transcriptional ArsR family regulator
MGRPDIEYLTELDRVTVLLHPLRLQIMELAIEETSGTEAARALGLPRQMVNYHVSALEKAGFLIRIGDVRRRNMVERRLQTSARGYLISPDILGNLNGARRRTPDQSSSTALLSLTARVQSELGVALHADPTAAAAPTVSFSSKLHFINDDARREFSRTLGESVVSVVREFSAPANAANRSRQFGLVLGLYPLPRTSFPTSEGDK